MATIDVKNAGGSTEAVEKPLAPGRAAAASSRPVALSTEDKTVLDAINTKLGATLVVGPAAATYTDKSGTITSGGAAQSAAASNGSRKGFFIQNVSSGDLWLNATGTAAATQPSMWLPPGSYFEFPIGGVPTTAISIYGATTGQAFSAREW